MTTGSTTARGTLSPRPNHSHPVTAISAPGGVAIWSMSVDPASSTAMRVAPHDLNGYQTLFGGVLLGHLKARAEEVGGALFGAADVRVLEVRDFIFSTPSRAGDRLRFDVTPSRIDETSALLCCRAFRQGRTQDEKVAECTMRVGLASLVDAQPLEANPASEWDYVSSHWAIGGDVDPAGEVRSAVFANLMDAAAVVFCRQKMGHKRVVTRSLSHYRLCGRAHEDDVLKLHFSICREGRTSLTVDCRVTLQVLGEEGQGELVATGRFVMVAVDDAGRSTPHRRASMKRAVGADRESGQCTSTLCSMSRTSSVATCHTGTYRPASTQVRRSRRRYASPIGADTSPAARRCRARNSAQQGSVMARSALGLGSGSRP